jgi:hypothetical protein
MTAEDGLTRIRMRTLPVTNVTPTYIKIPDSLLSFTLFVEVPIWPR